MKKEIEMLLKIDDELMRLINTFEHTKGFVNKAILQLDEVIRNLENKKL